MDDMFKQISVGVIIAAIGGVWVFATTRASIADVNELEDDVRIMGNKLEEDIDQIRANTDEIKDTFHRALIEQTEFRAQVREKLKISNQ